MVERELSFQERDPVGTYSTRPVTLMAAVSMVLLAAVATTANWASVTDPATAYLAVVATALSALGVTFWSSPLRAPFSRVGFVTVSTLSAAVLVLAAASTWGTKPSGIWQWAPIVVGLTIAQLAPYRPVRELVGVTILGGILTGFIAVLRPVSDANFVPPIVAVSGAAFPLVAVGAGAIAYAAALGRWYAPAVPRDRSATAETRASMVRAVQRDRVAILNDTVVPFFADLLQRDLISDADRERALVISNSIRAIMVADVDRSWLDTVVDHAAGQRADRMPGSEVVEDHGHLAVGMTTEQRIVVRAVIFALFDHPGFDPDGFGVVITRESGTNLVTLRAKLDFDDSILRSGLAAYFAVLRIAFGDLHVSFQRPSLRLRFSYDCR
jgi:hypothetical protein